MRRFVELNHVLRDGMDPYPGLPKPRFGALRDHEASRSHYAGKAEFHLGHYELPGNVGTYLDSPFHRYREGADLADLPLERVAGLPGRVLDAAAGLDRGVDVECEPADLAGCAVLLRTGWDGLWGTDAYWRPGPFVAAALVQRLLEGGAALLGVDFANVDDTADLARPVHTRLLGAGIPIVEHLCGLEALPRSGFRFSAVPLRIERGSSFPVRAYAELG